MQTFGEDEEAAMISIETLRYWLERIIQLDGRTDRELLYLSNQFDMTKVNLMQELVRVAMTILYAAPHSTTLSELTTGLYNPELAPDEFRRSNPDSVVLDAQGETLRAMELATMMG
jgi:hypothetical protein